jgi:hypothetical protein
MLVQFVLLATLFNVATGGTIQVSEYGLLCHGNNGNHASCYLLHTTLQPNC